MRRVLLVIVVAFALGGCNLTINTCGLNGTCPTCEGSVLCEHWQ